MATRSPFGLIEYRTHYRWAVILVTIFFLTLFFRFVLLQVVRGGEYQKEITTSRQRSERIPAERGLIVDRDGEVLARNVETHDLVMHPHRLKHPERTIELLRKLLRLDDNSYSHMRELFQVALAERVRYDRVVIRRDLVSEYCPFDSANLHRLEHKRKALWCAQCGRSYTPISSSATHCPHSSRHKLKWDENKIGADCKKCNRRYVATTSCPHDGSPLRERQYSLWCNECERGFNNEKAIVEANLYQMPGVKVVGSKRRVYPHRNLAAHLTGYMNQVNQRDLDKHAKTYMPGDRIGRSGVERAYEAELRGTWGTRNYIADRAKDGRRIQRSDADRPDRPVVDGSTVQLTIDLELQRILRNGLRYHRSGAAVILDVTTGELLASYSKPSFDPNRWSGRLSREEYRQALSNPYTPLMNKALTAYAPGSVYKTVTSTAALHTGLAVPQTEIQCNGYYEYGGRRFRCHNRIGHGSMDLVHAMSRSCDIYFYRMGEELGMDRLFEYSTRYFGFGRPTGIEIAESVGVVPDKDWHRTEERVWMPGFTLSSAVGQKDIKATPLQVARAYIPMAYDGKLLDVHIVRQLQDSKGNVWKVTRPKVAAELPIDADQLAITNEGLWRTVNDEHGTAFDARLPGVEVSGKTGTAEAAERKPGVSSQIATWLLDDHAWFVGFAPSRKPEIVVSVFLEHGHSGGKAAAPVAMKIFKAYFSRVRSTSPPASSGQLPNPIQSPGVAPSDNDEGSVNRAPIDIK